MNTRKYCVKTTGNYVLLFHPYLVNRYGRMMKWAVLKETVWHYLVPSVEHHIIRVQLEILVLYK